MEVKFLPRLHPRFLFARTAKVALAELRAWAEDTARERLRCSVRELGHDVWVRAERADPQRAREIRKLFGLEEGYADAKRHR
jgi:hypothetical protein